ncbi:hypothetical protein LTR36_006065 [Oleoguttula mirabilis]|uniref:Xylanolytic transcriptional activator regulatory domain-containing protein n=1 Tax=Oleoguttula mirabilis TaxID=1507867 RepID=A0AAV9JCU1_9PEZI|nr:hypothetical protein LTR36_006065 [Oleoguttula mirabilis]
MATSWAGYGPSEPAQGSGEPVQGSSSGDRPKKASQTRQLLSCTKCRERKVKECEFIVGEGNDYSPIQQSYEIRKLRLENQRLKERLQAAKLPLSGEEDDDDDSGEQKRSRTASRAVAARQRRFKTGDRIDNLYFGTPGLANIVNDFASLQMGSQSLTHTMPSNMPKAQEMYAFAGSMYPFPVLPGWGIGEGTAATLIQVLPARDELFQILESFQRRAQSCSFPHTSDEVTKREVERFLADGEGNAQKYPDMLALLLATLATGLQMGVYDRSGGKWVAGETTTTILKADVYLAASMQALRMASFMNQPTLLGIQALVMIGPYLTNSGRFLDAWTLFGTTVRMAHSIGLHRNPKFLDPAPPLRECMARQTLWWWMLHMDQQYSVTLGRPLGISGFGDCPPPEPLTTNPTILRLGEFVDHFTILARQILSSDGLMSVAKIDEFTDKLIGLWDTMPEALQFNESWSHEETPLPDWPLEVMSATLFAKVQSFLILLNRQRVERTQSAYPEGSPPGVMMPPPRPQPQPQASSSATQYGTVEQFLHEAPVRGRALVINSSIHLLQAFLFFHYRNPAVLICWTMGQQAFNACMILILDAWETGKDHNEWLVEQAFAVFRELDTKGVHKLAELAVGRISDGLAQLGNRREERERQAAAAAAASRRSSAHRQQQQPQQQPPPLLTLDTASMMDWSSDSVMGDTGMFLLEDPGLQSYVQQPFRPLGWHMAGSAHSSDLSNPPTPTVPTTVPVSQVTAAPFPVMSSAFMPTTIPVTNSPFAVGLQPRMPNLHRRAPTAPRLAEQPHGLPPSHMQQAAFTPINPIMPGMAQQGPIPTQAHQFQVPQQQHLQPQQQAQPSFSPLRGPRHSHHSHNPAHPSSSSNSSTSAGAGGGPRGVHKLDKPPRSQQRRK